MKPTESEVEEEIRCLREICQSIGGRIDLSDKRRQIFAQVSALMRFDYHHLDGLEYSYAYEANRWLNEGGQRPSETWTQLKLLGLD